MWRHFSFFLLRAFGGSNNRRYDTNHWSLNLYCILSFAQSCEKSIYVCFLFLGGYNYIYNMYVFIYIYMHMMLNILWSISSPCPLSFPNPPLTMLWSGKTPWWFPQKRPGVFASERDAKDKLQGDVCVFFLLEASRPGKKTSLLKKMNTEIFGSRGHWLTVYWKVHGCSPFTNLTHQKWYRPCPSIRDLKVPETFFGGNVQWPNIQGSFSQHDWRWIRRKKKLQNT